MSLFDDLRAAEPGPDCTLCDLIGKSSGEEKEVLRRVAAGTIGSQKLAGILKAHGTGIGRRTIERHRREEHTP